jgi:orotate phosphoribosyltransferase
MTEKEILSILKESNAIKEGHFLLSSGLHSNKYLQMAQVLQYPDKAKMLCEQLAKDYKDKNIDLVIAPAIGGIILSYQVASALGARSIFAERKEDKMKLRRGFKIKDNENVLIVEDVLTTGSSVKEIVSLVKKHSGNIVAIASLVDRSEKEIFKDIPFKALIKMDIETYPPEKCPLCKKNLPLNKPGSR